MANAGLLGHVGLIGPGAPGAVITGPGAHASLVGPDGSHIAGAAAGGAVIAAPKAGGAIAAGVAPGHIAVGHGLGLGVGVVGGWHGGWHGGLHPLAAGSGLEGQWIPDHTEQLYDDGSYKGEWLGHGHGW